MDPSALLDVLRNLCASRCKQAGLIAGASAALLPTAALAHDIAPFKLESPEWFVQVGLEINPTFGAHPFVDPFPPPITYWGTPATLNLTTGLIINAVGSCTHLVALHAGEAAPATTWDFDISCPAPGSPFGARETRIYRSVVHPGGTHVDAYGAVVGGLLGTVPGPSLVPRFVIIHGTIGVHLTPSPPPSPSPMVGSCPLKPPSGLPSAGDQDYPAGELLTIVDRLSSRLSMLIAVDGVHSANIGGVLVRQGPGGPILMDLRPFMQMSSFDPYAHALAAADVGVPVSVAQAIATGQAWVSVQVAPHPDGEIVGQITAASDSAVASYCTAGISSSGCAATMSASGRPSASLGSGFVLTCSNVEGQKTGLVFYGVSGPHAAPWDPASSSFLCVKAPTQRTPAQSSGGLAGQCNGALSLDWNAYQATHPTALGHPFNAGDAVWAQAWYRDPPAPKTTNLSNALTFTFAP